MPQFNRRWIIFVVVAVTASAIDLLASALLKNPELNRTARIGIALMPLPGDTAVIVLALFAIRRLDEFQKRVHFEAVAVAFLATGVAVFVYGYLQKAHVAGPLNAGLVWAFMLVFYAIGYFIATSHYR